MPEETVVIGPEPEEEGKEKVEGAPQQPKGEQGKPVTQEAIDREYRLRKEAEEKLEKSEAEKVALVERLQQQETPPEEEPVSKTYGVQRDGSISFPQSKEDWDDLAVTDPTMAMDLRIMLNQRAQTSQKESALRVAEMFPDMYKKDSEGKVLLSPTGHPVADGNSEQYKLFIKIAQESGSDVYGRPVILAATRGPELVALKMREVLGDNLKKKAEEEVNKAEQERQQRIRGGQISPPGATPPSTPKYEVKFNSEFERRSAEEKVARGIYSSLEDYCRIRDGNTNVIPFNRGV